MLGSETLPRAQELLRWLKNRFESGVRFYNEDTEEFAEGILAEDFGWLRPEGASGHSVLWRVDRIVVPQFTGLDLFQKEPTVQIGSRDSDITGARVDLAVWDDLVNPRTHRDPTRSSWWSKTAERRIDQGGVLLLVGTRAGAGDLFDEVANKQYENESGEIVKKYVSIAFPAHNESTCDAAAGGTHRQWAGNNDGCLLDAKRVS
jgi:hypothetical protein